MSKLFVDTALLNAYCDARRQFLRDIGCNDSCRDPLAEFAEWLVHQQLSGNLADSRFQKGYDLVCPAGRRVQVKYLANPRGRCRNEHCIAFSDMTDDYVLLIFEAFDIRALLVFRRESIGEVCAALKKKHPNQGCVLQFTQVNFRQIISSPNHFGELGMRVFLPQWTSA